VVVGASSAIVAVAGSGGSTPPWAPAAAPYRGPVHTDGKWSLQRMPSPPERAIPFLADVSCPTIHWCMAVGTYDTFGPPNATTPPDLHASSTQLPLAEVWAGSSWARVAIPGDSPTETDLAALSCTSPFACTAVGDVVDGSGLTPCAESWNGTTWTIDATAAGPAGSSAKLADVSCISPGECVAVGGWTDFGRSPWNGSSWKVEDAPAPAELWSLDDVSCTGPRACTTVGSFDAPGHGLPVFSETWDGRRWILRRTPVDSDGSASSISCLSADDCTAFVSPGVPELWTGHAWRGQEAPANLGVDAVSCAPDGACTAVGRIADRRGEPTVVGAERRA
jgi:hypothetical protein